MSYLGLDVGTTGCKAVVFDRRGRQIASAYREYPVISAREGWAELDPNLVRGSCLRVIAEAAGRAEKDPVRGLGISSQGEAFTPVGPNGCLLRNAMVSSDARAAEIARDWSADFGRERLYSTTGHTPHPMYTLFKLIWLRENEPDIWGNARSFYCFEELIHDALGVEPAIGWPLAGRTMMFNVCTHRWDADILSAVGLDESKLARTLASGEVVGRMAPAAARELGLADGAMVVAGGHDQPCGALGAGVASPGRAVYGMGTVDCITPAFPDAVFSEDLFRNNLATYDFTARGMYTTVAFSLTGGNALQWFRDEWGRAEAEEAAASGRTAYEVLLDRMDNEPSTLLVLPYLTPSGTPYFDTQVRGAILGLRVTTTRMEVLRALLEGVAFEMRLNMHILERSGVEVRELVGIGGGANSRKLVQLKADVLGKPIKLTEVTEAGCLGVAMLACAADSGEDIAALAREWVRERDVVQPDPSRAGHYAGRFGTYLELYPALRDLTDKGA